MKKSVLIRGPILTRSGYGEQARFAYRALKNRPDLFDVFVVPTNWGHTGWVVDDDPQRQEIDQDIRNTAPHIQQAESRGHLPFDVSIQVTIPQEWERIATFNIGYTAGTETTHISLNWVEKTEAVDRIIAVSNHSKSGFERTVYEGKNENGDPTTKKVTVPVDVVGFPVRDLEPATLDFKPTTSFNFLTVAQWGPRKNLENTISWFLEEFHDDPDVGLIAKVNLVRNCIIDRGMTEQRIKNLLNKHPDRKCRVYLLHGNMTDEEMAGLYTHDSVHALVNIAHGEGFGLPIFEAVCAGLPVVAPNWGGQADFLSTEVTKKGKNGKKGRTRLRCLATKVDYEVAAIQKEAVWEPVLIEQSSWCYPIKNSYKSALRSVHKNHTRMVSDAKKLQTHVLKAFSEESQEAKFVESVLATIKTSSAPSTTTAEFQKVVTL